MPKHKAAPLDPAKYAEAGTEVAHQIALFMWAASPEVREKYPELRWMFAIPNGGFRDKITAARLRAQGVKAGVPDIFLPVIRGEWGGLFIEMKKPKDDNDKRSKKGKTQNTQNEYLTYLQNNNYGAIICYGFEDARKTIVSYLEYNNQA